jgi:hypothetical protein
MSESKKTGKVKFRGAIPGSLVCLTQEIDIDAGCETEASIEALFIQWVQRGALIMSTAHWMYV